MRQISTLRQLERPRVGAARVLALTAGLVLCLLAPAASPSAAAGTAGPAGTTVDLRVVNWNIHTGIGSDGRLDLARTAGTLAALDADVIGLEEVDVHWAARSEWRDQVADLAEALDMRAFFGPIYDLDPATPGEPRRRYGVAVLTSLPILATENHEITRLSTQDADPAPAPAPGFPEVVVSAGGARVHVYATHLDYRGDPSVREAQVSDTLAILDEDRGRGGAAPQQVLVGDFNAPPEAPELAPLWGPLVDSWSAGSGTGLTYPAAAPVKRIDYVTHSPNVQTVSAEVVQTLASDHLPVVADLRVQRGR